MARKRVQRVLKGRTANQDRLYSDDMAEFLAAIEAFRRKHGRVPTLVEGMRIAISLGYVKTG